MVAVLAVSACEPSVPAVQVPVAAVDAGPPPATVGTVTPKKRTAPLSDPQASVGGARDYAIELLEERAYVELLQNLIEPTELMKVRQEPGGIETLASTFGASEKPAELLEMLRHTKGTTPEMGDDGTTATFSQTQTFRKALKFKLVEGRWYIDD